MGWTKALSTVCTFNNDSYYYTSIEYIKHPD